MKPSVRLLSLVLKVWEQALLCDTCKLGVTLQVVFSKQDRKTPREMAVEPGYGSRERSPGGHIAPAVHYGQYRHAAKMLTALCSAYFW